MREVDPNEIISKVILERIDGIIEGVKSGFGSAVDKTLAKFNVGYSDYIKRNYARCAQIKTILYRHQPVLLKQHYVSPYLRAGSQRHHESDVLNRVNPGSRLVIVGTAGCGKSLFMKHAYLEFVDNGKPFVPLFIELRSLNDGSGTSLRSHMLAEIQRGFVQESKKSFTN